MAKMKKHKFIKHNIMERIVKASIEKATLIPCHPWDRWFERI